MVVPFAMEKTLAGVLTLQELDVNNFHVLIGKEIQLKIVSLNSDSTHDGYKGCSELDSIRSVISVLDGRKLLANYLTRIQKRRVPLAACRLYVLNGIIYIPFSLNSLNFEMALNF